MASRYTRFRAEELERELSLSPKYFFVCKYVLDELNTSVARGSDGELSHTGYFVLSDKQVFQCLLMVLLSAFILRTSSRIAGALGH